MSKIKTVDAAIRNHPTNTLKENPVWAKKKYVYGNPDCAP
jgi:hypothetical protein